MTFDHLDHLYESAARQHPFLPRICPVADLQGIVEEELDAESTPEDLVIALDVLSRQLTYRLKTTAPDDPAYPALAKQASAYFGLLDAAPRIWAVEGGKAFGRHPSTWGFDRNFFGGRHDIRHVNLPQFTDVREALTGKAKTHFQNCIDLWPEIQNHRALSFGYARIGDCHFSLHALTNCQIDEDLGQTLLYIDSAMRALMYSVNCKQKDRDQTLAIGNAVSTHLCVAHPQQLTTLSRFPYFRAHYLDWLNFAQESA